MVVVPCALRFPNSRGGLQEIKSLIWRMPRICSKQRRLLSLRREVESSNDVSLGAQEDASKQGRKITDLDADAEESSKKAGDELESDKSKNQKIDEHVEAEKDDDPEEEEMKKHMEIIQNEEEIAIDAIPLATKPPMIVEYKIVKEGQKGFYHLIRADGSSKRYSSMIRMLRVWIRGRLRNFWNVGQRTSMELNRPA
ncbi:hypothetical protein Tco_0038254 [Tanacetum coccineum]